LAVGHKGSRDRRDPADIGRVSDDVRVIRLRFPGECRVCREAIEKGAEAVHDREARKVTCLACVARASLEEPAVVAEPEPLDLGEAGASAAREYERRRANRERAIGERWGRFAGLAKRLSDQPQHETAWRTGAGGEVEVAERLERRLRETRVVVMHDRRIPGSRANIDHLAVGPGGVTVIDAKNYVGKVRIDRRGGLFSPRIEDLRINGRKRTKLIEGVKRQIELVCAALEPEHPHVDVRGALCMAELHGLPMFRHLEIDGIAIDGTRQIAKIAAREADPPIDAEAVTRLLAERFPRA
jgi:Nuclease-related domain